MIKKRASPVIRVHPLVMLFLIQFLLIFLGLTLFLFFKYRKINVKEIIARGEAIRLRDELKNMEINKDNGSGWKDKFSDLQKKYEHVKSINAKLNESINKLLPEAKRTNGHEQIIKDIEQSYIELESFIVSLQKEKELFHAQSKSLEGDINKLSQKLEHSVSKEEYDKLDAKKNGLESKFDKLKEDLAVKSTECESLKKNYLWLEKEYNALYDNISENKS
jgi:chromosome segregation ATPase